MSSSSGTLLPARSTARARKRYVRPKRSRGRVPGVGLELGDQREVGGRLGVDRADVVAGVVDDRLARPLGGQAPAVPAEHRLVQVEVGVGLAGHRRRRRALHEPLVRLDRQLGAGPSVRPPRSCPVPGDQRCATGRTGRPRRRAGSRG